MIMTILEDLKSLICTLLIWFFLMAKKLYKPFEGSQRSLKMDAGAFYIPKEKPPGEDAHCICVAEQAIGVADGVAMWAESGVDAGEYARELMTNSVIAIQNQPIGAVNPKKVLKEAHAKTKAEGSATACIISLVGHHLHAANVGDSGFMVFRDGAIVYQSPVLLHRFNRPFQLGKFSDDPSSAKELRVKVKSGDVVVAATDGLFDNMHAVDILNAVKHGLEGSAEPRQLAETLAKLALSKSLDETGDTPFSIAATRETGETLEGGKPDDITIIVAYIV